MSVAHEIDRLNYKASRYIYRLRTYGDSAQPEEKISWRIDLAFARNRVIGPRDVAGAEELIEAVDQVLLAENGHPASQDVHRLRRAIDAFFLFHPTDS